MSGLEAIQPLFFRHPVSATSHLLYAAWAVYATALFARLGSDRVRRAAAVAFGLCLVALYVFSGLYHAVSPEWPQAVTLFRRLDLAAIHGLIAGTCTPVFVLLLAGRSRRWWLGALWTLATAGAATKLLLPLPPFAVTLGLYVALGLVGLGPVGWQRDRLPPGALRWLLSGAAVYVSGGLMEALRWPHPWPGVVGPHELLHACDMLGSTAHVVFTLRFVLRGGPSTSETVRPCC
ncbi:MAG: hemolysin III family protein [Gemmataceae bacterium]